MLIAMTATTVLSIAAADIAFRFYEGKYARLFGLRAIRRPEDQQALVH